MKISYHVVVRTRVAKLVALCLKGCFSMADEDLFTACCDNKHLIIPLCGNLSSLDELHDFTGNLLWLAFLDDMAAICNHIHLVLALHVSNRQFSVLSLRSCQK